MKVGLIGIGNMGRPIALNLLESGFELTVYDMQKERMQEVAVLGADVACSPREVAQASDIIITSLPNDTIVEKVILGEDGVLAGAERGAIIIDTSTVSPKTTKKIGETVEETGAEYLGVAISGPPSHVASRTLTLMAGGKKGTFQKSIKVLKALGGEKIHYLGDLGTGNILKLVRNYALGVINVANAEALVLGKKAGIRPDILHEVLSKTNPLLESKLPRIRNGDFEIRKDKPGFSVNLMYKDLSLATEMGEEFGVPLLLGNIALQILQFARADGIGERDNSSIVTLLEKLSVTRLNDDAH